jgi:3',5'-cyclic-AMP phosphodiesterase
MSYRIAQLSDPHLSAAKPFFVENFRRIAAAINAAQPDLVINTGDLALDGTGNEDDLAAARRLHDELFDAVQFLPGNHDVGDNPDVPDGHDAIDARLRDRYLRHFGADWWHIDAPGWRILGVDAQLIGADLDAASEQRQFIVDTVAGRGERQIALFIHKPLFDRDPTEAVVGGRFLNPEPRRQLGTTFGSCQPKLVGSGHVHQFRSSRTPDTHYVWAPSTGFYISDARQPRYGLKEVGYVMHALNDDGSHDSAFVAVAGTHNLCIADFPDAYGPMP